MNNALRIYYLQQMGIDVWQTRLDNKSQKADSTITCHSSLEINPLDALAKIASSCKKCILHQSRQNVVFARGNPKAHLMIIGEAPGFYEDKEGRPFVGKAGKLLNKMLKTIGFSDEDVYIANILKCRPPDNRDPKVDEITSCTPYLKSQIELVKPKLILAVGRFAGQFLIKESLPLAKMRQQTFNYLGHPVIVSYHPAYLLRNPKDKKKSYVDLLRVKTLLNSK